MGVNLYIHFPFCRRKCAYCALPSRAGVTVAARAAYVQRLADEVRAADVPAPSGPVTLYFGGGTPALCTWTPLVAALRARGLLPAAEFTVELHPADVTPAVLDALVEAGVTRVSLGIQSFDDATLAVMGRGYTAETACAAFRQLQRLFPNAGFDLIAGYPSDGDRARAATIAHLRALAPAHVSVYTLIREPGTPLDRAVRTGRTVLPDDEAALAELAEIASVLDAAGLSRYEISNWARPGCECRHNCAVWHGEDYLGLGDGAHGRLGRVRTVGANGTYTRTVCTVREDALERSLLALRTRAGFDPAAAIARFPVLAPYAAQWARELAFAAQQGLVCRAGAVWRLTPRGTEVCDAVLAQLL